MEMIAIASGRELYARLCEVERGLFHVNYRTGHEDCQTQTLPRYQVGACASDAMRRIEESARLNGYRLVVWDTAVMAVDAAAGPEVEKASLSDLQPVLTVL